MKYKVGKPNYKSSFIYSALIIAWAIFLILFSPFSAMNICGFFLIFLIIFIYLPSMAFCNNIWEVDEHYLKYTFYDNVVEKSRAFFHSLFTRNIDYQMKIKLDKIYCNSAMLLLLISLHILYHLFLLIDKIYMQIIQQKLL